MGVIRKKKSHEFDLDNGYSINRVELKKVEEEHTHRFIELVYTLSGRGVHTVDGREYRVSGGDLLIVNYRCRHAVEPLEHLCYVDIMLKPEYVNATLEGTEDLFLLLKLRDFSDLSNNVIRDNLLLHFDAEEQKRIETLLEWTAEEQRTNAPARELMMYSALSMLLCLVFRKMTERQGAVRTLNEQLLAYMARNCANRLLIGEMAAACGYTAEHFSRLFKAYAGQSPSAYLTRCRIDRAKELLLKTDAPVEVVLQECGFSNRTVFFQRFLESTGLTPLQYRKERRTALREQQAGEETEPRRG